jgi:hypothetical protein
VNIAPLAPESVPSAPQIAPSAEEAVTPRAPTIEVGDIPSTQAPAPDADSPAGSEPSASAPRTVAVFSLDGLAEAASRVVGEEICLCGVKIPVRAEDYGSSIYCPVCGTEIHVGPTLDSEKYRVAQTAGETPSAPASEASRSSRRFRLIRSRRGVTVAIVLLTVVGLRGYRIWESPKTETGVLDVPQREPAPAPKPDIPKWTLTAADIEKMPQNRDPVAALIGARRWLSWLRRDSSVSDSDPRLAKLAQVIELLEKRLAPPITLEMIEKLSWSDDPGQALVQAQMWQEALRDQEAAANDPRLAGLTKVIGVLSDRLTPKLQTPPAFVADFQKLLQQIADKLKEGNFAEASKATNRVEQLFEQAERLVQDHPDELAPYSRRLLTLKSGFNQQKATRDGVRQIRQWFQKAAESLTAGQVTEGLAFMQRARFFAAWRTPANEDEIREFITAVKNLAPEVRFARGKRAVDDAVACDRAGDRAGRDREAQRAQSLLPGLPESRIKALLEQIQPWTKEGTAAAARVWKPASPLARSIERREFYETALERYGDGQWQELVSTCLQAESLHSAGEAESEKMHARMGVMLFDVLEMVVGKELQPGSLEKKQAKPIEQLSAVRRWLDQLAPWKSDGRWKALDAALRQQGDEMARNALERAVVLAAEDKLIEAIAEASTVESLGNPSTEQRAQRLCAQWRAEVKLRADSRAEQEQWNRIQTLADKANAELELWNELRQFRQRFPKGAYTQDIDSLLTRTRERIEGKCQQALHEIQDLIAEKQWAKARARMELLRGAPLQPTRAAALQRLQERCEEVKTEAASRFLLLGQHRKLLTEENVLALLAALPEILEMDPENEEARSLFERVQHQGAIRSHKLIASALLFKNQKAEVYEDKLRRAAALDPEGSDGKRARELLKEL